jgi:drug/metabolite transporter (DMT)-like permease
LSGIAATRVTVFLALSPITAAALGIALLGEPVTVQMVAGVACVAAGLWVAGGRSEQSTQQSEDTRIMNMARFRKHRSESANSAS